MVAGVRLRPQFVTTATADPAKGVPRGKDIVAAFDFRMSWAKAEKKDSEILLLHQKNNNSPWKGSRRGGKRNAT